MIPLHLFTSSVVDLILRKYKNIISQGAGVRGGGGGGWRTQSVIRCLRFKKQERKWCSFYTKMLN